MSPIATIECGDHGEDTLRAVKIDDSIVLERTRKTGRVERWPILATDTLRVSHDMWGNTSMAGIEWKLTLVSHCGSSSAITHLEFDAASGGVTDKDIAAFVNTVAAAAGCTAKIAAL
jgi:hypothetical protein